eukprot:scaffold68297_cov120-Phaeocystis_antarctica.AAC.9
MGSWHACTKHNPVCSSASSLNTAFRFTHGSHHDAQKLRTHAPEATATAASASSAGTKTPPAPAMCFGCPGGGTRTQSTWTSTLG